MPKPRKSASRVKRSRMAAATKKDGRKQRRLERSEQKGQPAVKVGGSRLKSGFINRSMGLRDAPLG